jgi:hypothetical protein
MAATAQFTIEAGASCSGTGTGARQAEASRTVCCGCAVRASCLHAAGQRVTSNGTA